MRLRRRSYGFRANELLRVRHERGGCDLKCLCKLPEGGNRRLANAAFDLTHERPVHGGAERQTFLGEPNGISLLAQRVAKGFLNRSCHPERMKRSLESMSPRDISYRREVHLACALPGLPGAELTVVVGFKPEVGVNARLAILGTLPGPDALAAGRYYANPANCFWRLMGDIVGRGAADDYDQRVARIQERGIAVWDVLHSACRDGADDGAIVRSSRKPNDFVSFMNVYPTIRFFAFNGRDAELHFRDLAMSNLHKHGHAVWTVRLPSTSGAHAIAYAKKLEQWRGCISAALHPAT